MNHPLRDVQFEWHDLPISRISIVEKGLILNLMPFNESTQHYDLVSLSLLEPESMTFDIQGQLNLKDLDGLEVYDFSFTESAPGRISGELGILPNSGTIGYWKIQFTNSIWQLVSA